MTLLINLLLVIVGTAIIIYGSNWLVDGASALAKRLAVPDIVIGLTVVAFGTSSPELTVSLMAANNGSTDIAIGNVLGSNIFNSMVILGVAALILPLKVQKNTIWNEIPLSLLAALMVGALANDRLFDGALTDQISRAESFALLGFFGVFMAYSLYSSRTATDAIEPTGIASMPLGKSIFFIVVGLAGLVGGGKLMVDNAVALARAFDISEAIIGLTIIAAGTSMPELATSAVAARKGNSDIAIGNVVGSNIFNVFLILGITGVVEPLPFRPESNVDILMTIASSFTIFLFPLFAKSRITRTQGGFLLAAYVAYVGYLISQAV